LQVERVAGGLSAFGDDDAICSAAQDGDVGGEGVGAVAGAGSQCVVEVGCSGIEGVEGAAAGRWRVKMLASGDARIDREDVIGFGFAIEECLQLLEFGCFGNGEYCSAVAGLANRNTLLLCGMESHICVMQTALGALNQGLYIHVAADAVSSRTQLNWKLGLNRMQAAGAVISSTEMMIYELLGKSGTTAFKEMLKHLK